MSMDMDALQSTDKGAVDAALLSAQAQPEMLARLFAEMFLKPLYKGILELASLPQSRARLIRLRGQYVEVNPVTWDRDMDVSVNVAIGSTNTDRKVGVLKEVVADQTAVLQQLGPDNPVVDLPRLFNTKRQILRLMGIKDAENYFVPLPPDWKPEPPPPPQPSPDELWIQAEKEMAFQKAMKELAIEQDRLAIEKQKADQDAELRAIEIEVKRRAAETGPHNEDIEKYKVDQETASRERIEMMKLEFEREKLAVQMELERYKADKMAEAAKAKPESKEGDE